MNTETLKRAYNTACDDVDARQKEWDELADDAPDEDIEASRTALSDAVDKAEQAKQRLDDAMSIERARGQHTKVDIPETEERKPIRVSEPDMYVRGGKHSFIDDLYRAQLKGDPLANERVTTHHRFEVEKRALSTSTFGGLIPPQYLLDLYAKASRNGRIFVDQVNHQDLPDYGMSLIIPRLTTGLAAAVQSSENSAVTTQDIVETDLTVPVVTIGGYSPVSRQGLERAAYNEEILMEDLIARYWAALDTEAINGSGSPPHMTGFLNTAGIKTSAASSGGLSGCFSNIADVIQQINTATGGLGYVADRIVMHPRRWGVFTAGKDTAGRPLLGISGLPVFNVDGVGDRSGYGYVGTLQGLAVYTDANIPTNLGAGTNEDWILVYASPIVHCWERTQDPVTLAFEQQAGTSLQVQLVAYGYAAFTAGRYPAACGVVTGLTTPSFGS